MICITSMALLLLILLSLFASPSAADPLYYICGSENFIKNSTYRSNLNHLISTLSSNASATGFATSSTGIVPDRVYGLTLCRGDIDIANCRSCISTAISDTQQLCSNNKEATIWYDYCQLRYSNQNFLYGPDVTTSVQQLLVNSQNVSADRLQRFEILNTELMGNLSDLAVRNTSRLFATGEAAFTDADNIYGLVQCTLDLSVGDCRTCLQQTVDFSKIYLQGGRGGRALGMWCNIRYEFYKFYNGTPMLQLASDQSPSSPLPTNASKPNVTHPPADLSHGGKERDEKRRISLAFSSLHCPTAYHRWTSTWSPTSTRLPPGCRSLSDFLPITVSHRPCRLSTTIFLTTIARLRSFRPPSPANYGLFDHHRSITVLSTIIIS